MGSHWRVVDYRRKRLILNPSRCNQARCSRGYELLESMRESRSEFYPLCQNGLVWMSEQIGLVLMVVVVVEVPEVVVESQQLLKMMSLAVVVLVAIVVVGCLSNCLDTIGRQASG